MTAIVDTHPKGRDAHAARFMGSAGLAEASPAQPCDDPEGIPAFDPIELRRYFSDRAAGKLIDPSTIIKRPEHIKGAGNNA